MPYVPSTVLDTVNHNQQFIDITFCPFQDLFVTLKISVKDTSSKVPPLKLILNQ